MDTLFFLVSEPHNQGKRRTLEIYVCGPVAFNVRNHSLAAAVKAWVIPDTDSDAGSIQVMECGREWRKRIRRVTALGILIQFIYFPGRGFLLALRF
jgi:hypothetical protein